MNGDLTRRGVLAGAAALALPRGARAQHDEGFAGLGRDAAGYAPVTPGRAFAFPADHGPHPDFRIEWWYVTANLVGDDGEAYGAQWTLFRQAMAPNAVTQQGWATPQLWMGHAAVTSAAIHRFGETLSRGGIGTAGAEASPFAAYIDTYALRAGDGLDAQALAPLTMRASGKDFALDLALAASQPLVLQGDGGFSIKSDKGKNTIQASYYYSQPFFAAQGRLTFGGRRIDVRGQAWLDREWSSQPLNADQSGWDWFSLHLPDGDRLMLFRLRAKGGDFLSGNWIARDGVSVRLASGDIALTPRGTSSVGGKALPTAWRIAIAARGLAIDTVPLNPQAWMATRFPYWEGPIRFSGTHAGVGYLEMTGY